MPLANLSGEWVERMREGLQEQRLDVVTDWSAIETRLGNAASIIGPLTELTAEFPLAESLVAALMRALHATGRGVHALDCYTSVRKRLTDELGIDPGPELQQLHQALLRGDLDTDPVAPAPARPAPAQLPLDVRGFTARRAELTHLDATLAAAETTGVTILVISGTAGVGKTALAVHWAHQVAEEFPDGQLYVNLRGFDPGGSVMASAEAVRWFLDAFQVPPQRIPVDLDAQAALYRSQLAGKRVLVVLDNARDTSQVRPLLPGSPGCLVVVTSRNQLSGLIAADAAHPITLDLLAPGEARQLLVRRLGADRVAAEPVAVKEIIARCAHLPLALALVAARAALRPQVGLQLLAEELRDNRQRWQALTGDDPNLDVRAVLSWSYQTLSPAAARLFRLLGLHPGPDITTPAAASLAGLPASDARGSVVELTGASLLVEHTPGRYSFHDLLRAYASDLAHRIDPDQHRHTAMQRMLDHYLHTADTAARLLNSTVDPIMLTAPAPGVTPQHLSDHQQALGWFTAERPVLLAAIDQAVATGFDTHVWQLAWTLWEFLDRRGDWHDWAATGRAAVAAAHRLADPVAQARAHRHLAIPYIQMGRLEDAHTELHRAVDLATRAGDQTGQAQIHHDLAVLWERRGGPARALEHARQALDLYRAAGHQVGQAYALNAVGWCHAMLGEHQQAVTHCRQALTLHQNLGDRYGQAATWGSLGYAQHHLGQHAHAITSYQHTLDLLRDLGYRYNEAEVLIQLGDTHHTTSNPPAARDAWQQALTILEDLHHPNAAHARSKLSALDTPTTT